ncbi:transposase [Xanthomonas citri]|uniref:transposase n=1 Tax=Xanthomonas citri TaxID=346 RepID=UPI001F3F4F12|nr:transposase [Xanthomonas citri]
MPGNRWRLDGCAPTGQAPRCPRRHHLVQRRQARARTPPGRRHHRQLPHPPRLGRGGAKASLRAKVEHPFRVIKRQFGYAKVRYRGLVKNTAQVLTLFALSNLWLKRKQLMPAVGKLCL